MNILIILERKLANYMKKLKINNTTFNKNIDQLSPCELFVVVEDKDNKCDYNMFTGVFMKLLVGQIGDTQINAVNLKNGKLYYINPNTILHSVEGELII